jgi:hypothetical protein
MNPVALNGSRNVDQILVDHRHHRVMVLCRQIAKDFIERPDVILPIIGRKRNAGKKNFHVSPLEA